MNDVAEVYICPVCSKAHHRPSVICSCACCHKGASIFPTISEIAAAMESTQKHGVLTLQAADVISDVAATAEKLRAENERLRIENARLGKALAELVGTGSE